MQPTASCPGDRLPSFGPTFAKAADGKLWLVTREDIEVVDSFLILGFEQIRASRARPKRFVADGKTYWQNMPEASRSSLHLPARIHDLAIDYTALSLTAPEKVHFKYKLEGQDSDWREVVNDREVQYSNLPPGPYRSAWFACNSDGVWNEQGDSLEFFGCTGVLPDELVSRPLRSSRPLQLVWVILPDQGEAIAPRLHPDAGGARPESGRASRANFMTPAAKLHGLMLRSRSFPSIAGASSGGKGATGQCNWTGPPRAIAEGRDAVQGIA